MSRREWKFSYPASEVGAAAAKRANHHKERRDWWQGQQDEAEKKLRDKGLEFRENEVTGGLRVDAVVDPELKMRYEECRSKVRDHERQRREFGTYATVLNANGDQSLDLALDDVEFFDLA